MHVIKIIIQCGAVITCPYKSVPEDLCVTRTHGPLPVRDSHCTGRLLSCLGVRSVDPSPEKGPKTGISGSFPRLGVR
jgi:hypothetical protein